MPSLRQNWDPTPNTLVALWWEGKYVFDVFLWKVNPKDPGMNASVVMENYGYASRWRIDRAEWTFAGPICMETPWT